jgi:hypothetical protein
VLDDEVRVHEVERAVGKRQWPAEVRRHELVECLVRAPRFGVKVDSDQPGDAPAMLAKPRRAAAAGLEHDSVRSVPKDILEQTLLGSHVRGLHAPSRTATWTPSLSRITFPQGASPVNGRPSRKRQRSPTAVSGSPRR